MITCCVGYIILFFLVFFYKKGSFCEWRSRETIWRIWLILFVSNTIALVLFLSSGIGAEHMERVQRNSYGEGSKRETYVVTAGKDVKKQEVVVDIEERSYTQQEIRKIFREIIAELDQVILGENKSFDHVEKDLNLLNRWKKYPVQIQWEINPYEVMDVRGRIQQEKTKKEGSLVEVKGTLLYGNEKAYYMKTIQVYPQRKNKAEKMLDDITELLREQEEKTREKAEFHLPDSVDGTKIYWEQKIDMRGYYILLLGIAGAVLIAAQEQQNKEKKRKERKEQMLTDYPEMINKFTLLLSTGMTVKSVWERIVKNYEEQKQWIGTRAAYEEMEYTYHEMQGGVSEKNAYERFGIRCGVSEYMKFGALLAQNMKKGAKGICDMLQMEAIQAFENRKNRAKRLGEEAGTKLLIPMFAMLAVVLILVIVPAFMSMQL